MCRITGIYTPNAISTRSAEAAVAEMTRLLTHGGPDGSGLQTSGKAVFGHRRLSIIAPETAGQPFSVGADMLTYNGELYNYSDLRTELAEGGVVFTTVSDTEVVFYALKVWGVRALSRFNGMFALAYWSAGRKELILARDHVGMKPLYFSCVGRELVFVSELKALRAYSAFPLSINHDAVTDFLRRGYIGAPATIFREVQKVPAGMAVVVNDELELKQFRFYEFPNLEERKSGVGSDPEDVSYVLKESCKRHLQADVPVGVLLSGGVDSSLLLATLAQFNPKPIQTFTLGFSENEFDEAPAAEAIATYFGTVHHSFYVDSRTLLGAMDRFEEVYDEPFGDSSGLATLLLSEQVSKHVKCVLGGDGGDEVFGGYAKYRATLAFNRAKRWLPWAVRKKIAHWLATQDSSVLAAIVGKVRTANKHDEDRIYKFIESLPARTTAGFFSKASDYTGNDIVERLGKAAAPPTEQLFTNGNLVSKMSMQDLRNFLEGDLMVKTDRAAMRYGLEVRFPFLDKDVINYGLLLDDKHKIANGVGKRILRKELNRRLPAALINSDKNGFSVPLDWMLRNGLAEQLMTMASDIDFLAKFRLPEDAVADIISDYLERKRYINAHSVWFLLVLYRWNLRWLN